MITKSVEYLRRKFESKIDKTAKNGCWIWKAGKSDGYGHIRHYNTSIRVHRLSMHFYRGFDLNSDLQVNHKTECNNRACCNPDHLYLGTSVDNNRDTILAGNHREANKTHCPQGHEYSVENTYWNKNTRQCRICRYYASKRHRNKRRSE